VESRHLSTSDIVWEDGMPLQLVRKIDALVETDAKMTAGFGGVRKGHGLLRL
jgi:hypothetical protein